MSTKKRRQRLKATDIPAKMRACGVEIDVKLEDLNKNPEEEQFGEYVEWQQLLLIDVHHPKSTLKDTIVHEWLHAVLHLSGLSPLLDATNGLEEAVVRTITSAVRDAIDLEKLVITDPSKNSSSISA